MLCVKRADITVVRGRSLFSDGKTSATPHSHGLTHYTYNTTMDLHVIRKSIHITCKSTAVRGRACVSVSGSRVTFSHR